MTANPLPPTYLLTIDDYLALGEDEHVHTELQEGRLLMTPSPTPDHMEVISELYLQLRSQLPENLSAVIDVDIDLELAPVDQPGSSRRPDLIVVDHMARRRVRGEGGMIRASEVILVVEVVSHGSKHTDYVLKRAEYAEAGIEHYWIIDTAEPISLHACNLTDEFGYVDDGAVVGKYTTDVPFKVTVELDQLIQT